MPRPAKPRSTARSPAKAKTGGKAGAKRRAAPVAGRRKPGLARRVVKAVAAAVRSVVGAGPAPSTASLPPSDAPGALPAVLLSEEQRIESSKYTSRPATKAAPRLFEEERFVFPETYGVNRLRILVKDPQWLFAYWDVAPSLLSSWRSELGERTMALARFTLRVYDPGHAEDQVILLPVGARSWYIRAERAPRAYSAELGLLLPSGEFRSIARSNTVDTPRVGPSPVRATRKVPYSRIPAELFGPPTRPSPADSVELPADGASATLEGRRTARKGGASDVFRR